MLGHTLDTGMGLGAGTWLLTADQRGTEVRKLALGTGLARRVLSKEYRAQTCPSVNPGCYWVTQAKNKVTVPLRTKRNSVPEMSQQQWFRGGGRSFDSRSAPVPGDCLLCHQVQGCRAIEGRVRQVTCMSALLPAWVQDLEVSC